MSNTYSIRIKLALSTLEKAKKNDELTMTVDKNLSAFDNAIILEAGLNRVRKEIATVELQVSNIQKALNEWSQFILKVDKAERKDEDTKFSTFTEDEKVVELTSEAQTLLSELHDTEATILTAMNSQRSKAERDQRAEFREHTREMANIAPAPVAAQPVAPAAFPTLYRLPTLEITPFKGQRREWPAFEEAFNAAVDSKPGSDIEKLNILRSYLIGEPHTLIAGLRLEKDNYAVAKKLLKDTYGDKRDYVRTLYTELNALKPCNTLNDTKQFVLELERVARELEAAGEDIEGTQISLMLEKKLNKNFLRTILNAKREDPDNWNTTKLREELKAAVQRETAIQEVMSEYNMDHSSSHSQNRSKGAPGFKRHSQISSVVEGDKSKHAGGKYNSKPAKVPKDQSNSKQKQKGYKSQSWDQTNKAKKPESGRNKGQGQPQTQNPESQRQFHSQGQNQGQTETRGPGPCAFCGDQHWHNMCPKYTTHQQRITIAREKKLCLRCLRANHIAKDCPRPATCYDCRKPHPTALCRNKERQHTQVSSLMEQQMGEMLQLLKEQRVTSEVQNKNDGQVTAQCNSIHQDPCNKVLLMTIESTVFNPTDPTKNMVAMIFIDPGAQRSFITSEAAMKLGLSSMTKEECYLTAFGEKVPKRYQTDLVKLGFLCPGGDRMIINLNKMKFLVKEMPMISPTELDAAELRRRKLRIPKLREPEILLGMNIFNQLKVHEEGQLPSGFSMCNSRLGPLLCGEGQLENASYNDNITYVLSVHEHESFEFSSKSDDVTMDNQIYEFFGLNTIGMDVAVEANDKDEIMLQFRKNLTFIDGRYQVALPFNHLVDNLPTNYKQAKARLAQTLKKTQTIKFS